MEKSELSEEYHIKGEFLMSSGLTIILEMKLVKLASQVSFPINGKFSWIACNKDKPDEEFVLFDNYHKPPHFHIDRKDEFTFFTWKSNQQAQRLFWEKVEKKFGYFLTQIKYYEK